MLPADPIHPTRILVTGAGGPAAIAVLRAYERDASVTLVAADMDPWAAGLYLVPASNRVVVPAGAAPHFVDALVDLCRQHRIDVLVPTVDCELEPVAGAVDRFDDLGVRLLLPAAPVLAVTLDKLALATACTDVVRVPRTERASTTDPGSWDYPVIVKPRRGSGSRGVDVVASAAELIGRRPVGRHDGPGAPARRGVLGRRARRPPGRGARRRAPRPRPGRLRRFDRRLHRARPRAESPPRRVVEAPSACRRGERADCVATRGDPGAARGQPPRSRRPCRSPSPPASTWPSPGSRPALLGWTMPADGRTARSPSCATWRTLVVARRAAPHSQDAGPTPRG